MAAVNSPAAAQDYVSAANIDDMYGYGTTFLNPDRFEVDIINNIQYFGSKTSPVLSWAQMAMSKPATEIDFSWQEDEYFTQRDIKAKLWEKDGVGAGGEKIYVLQLLSGADWHTFESAVKTDTWANQGPLIFMNVMDASDKTKHCVFTIEDNAIVLGTATRDVISTNNAGDTTQTAMAAVTNAVVLWDEGPDSDGLPADKLYGGVSGEVSAVDATKISGLGYNTDPDDGTAGLAQFTFSSEVCDVYVHVITPNEALKGFPQGSGLPTETRKKTRSARNYVQIFKTPYSISNTLKAVKLRGGPELAILRKKKLIQHKIDIQMAMLFQGGGTEGTDWGVIGSSNDNPVTRFMGLGIGQTTEANAGIIRTKNAEFDSRFQFDPSTATMETLNNLVEALFDDPVDDPSDTKTVFCSKKWLKAFANLGLEVHTDNTSYSGQFIFGQRLAQPNRIGLEITEIVTPMGKLRLVDFPAFRGQYENYALIIDFNHVAYRPLRPTKLVANAGDRTVDGQIDYYITETGIQIMHESAHAIMKLV